MKTVGQLLNKRWWQFQWQYWRGHTPWDTNITPPEVMAFIKIAEPGRALDLGCGTGTNAITMACKGWQVLGVDYAPRAIRMAKRKAAKAGLAIDFRVADVRALPLNENPFDYILDIGCLHSIDSGDHQSYARQVAQLLAPTGVYMLYAWLPRTLNGKHYGLTVEQVHALFQPALSEMKTVVGEEKGSPTAWYWFKN